MRHPPAEKRSQPEPQVEGGLEAQLVRLLLHVLVVGLPLLPPEGHVRVGVEDDAGEEDEGQRREGGAPAKAVEAATADAPQAVDSAAAAAAAAVAGAATTDVADVDGGGGTRAIANTCSGCLSKWIFGKLSYLFRTVRQSVRRSFSPTCSCWVAPNCCTHTSIEACYEKIFLSVLLARL